MESWKSGRAGQILFLLTTLLQPVRTFAQGPLAVPHPVSTMPATVAVADARAADTLFRKQQIANPRVLAALVDTKFTMKDMFRERGLPYPGAGMYLRAFKREHQLEVWVQPTVNAKYILLKTYTICTISGQMGPKRAEGDEQTPEGFYLIDDFNPRSDYHLSLHLNYPNAADKLRDAKVSALGGSIYIHGGCKTIGCLPLTDQAIKEVYWLALESRTSSKPIPVHIFPTRLSTESMAQLNKAFKGDVALMSFWNDLKRGYDYFEDNRELPPFWIDPVGRYRVAEVPAVGLLPKDAPAQQTQQATTSSSKTTTADAKKNGKPAVKPGPRILGEPIAPAPAATPAPAPAPTSATTATTAVPVAAPAQQPVPAQATAPTSVSSKSQR